MGKKLLALDGLLLLLLLLSIAIGGMGGLELGLWWLVYLGVGAVEAVGTNTVQLQTDAC